MKILQYGLHHCEIKFDFCMKCKSSMDDKHVIIKCFWLWISVQELIVNVIWEVGALIVGIFLAGPCLLTSSRPVNLCN